MGARWLLTSAGVALAVAASSGCRTLPGRPDSRRSCVQPPAGLVGWWSGNGNGRDAITGLPARTIGNTTFADAVVGQGFKLDGDGDHVEIPDSARLRPARVTVEAWVRFDSLDTPIVSEFGALGLQYIVFKKNSRVFNFEAYSLRKERRDAGDLFAFSVADVNGFGGEQVAYSTTQIVTNRFYHVVGTYDGAQVRIYVDGSLEGQAAVSLDIDYGTRPVYLGTSGETVFDGKLHGIIDEASVYDRALDATEVRALHAAGGAGKVSGPTCAAR